MLQLRAIDVLGIIWFKFYTCLSFLSPPGLFMPKLCNQPLTREQARAMVTAREVKGILEEVYSSAILKYQFHYVTRQRLRNCMKYNPKFGFLQGELTSSEGGGKREKRA